MRVAVVSDIHSNLHALEAVLAAIEAEAPDELWCLGDLVGYGPRPNECCALIAERADGNAFYVEELVKMLIEDGVIETGDVDDPWLVHVERLAPERVPATLTGVLQTRLDSLAPAERDALQRSSVVGRVFWDGAVASLGQDGLEATATSLEQARQRELVLRHSRSSFDDSGEYRICVQLRDDDDPQAIGLEVGSLPGGRYALQRLTGEPRKVYDLIGPTFQRLAERPDRDPSRPGIEFYRRRNIIDLLLPVV